MSGITIAVDGYSSCGKSTMAKDLAAHLGYIYVDTGAMYRAITLFALDAGMIKDGVFDRGRLLDDLDEQHVAFEVNPESRASEMHLNGVNVEQEIRKMRVSEWVSQVSALLPVREKMVALQRVMGENGSVVMDGRDIGTVVFPNAELKLFMTASEDVRAQRRYKELQQKGQKVSLEEILENLQHRDYEDTHRKESPLRQAEDAIVIDNSALSMAQQLSMAIDYAHSKVGIQS